MTSIRVRCFAAVLLLCSVPLAAYSQKTKPSPDEKPRTVKKELKKAYVDWVRDVEPILTDEERSAWDKLKTDDEREQFITISSGIIAIRILTQKRTSIRNSTTNASRTLTSISLQVNQVE